MYDIYTYIWVILMVNVGKYTIHGSYGLPGYGIGGDYKLYVTKITVTCTFESACSTLKSISRLQAIGVILKKSYLFSFTFLYYSSVWEEKNGSFTVPVLIRATQL